MREPIARKAAAVPALLILFASMSGGPSAPAPAAPLALERPALLVIDIQNFYFEGGKLPLVGCVEASLKAKSVIDVFRAKKLPVIFVQHLPQGVERFDPEVTDAQYAIHPNVAPVTGETIVVKHFANSFRETQLAALLKDRNIKTLVVTGMQTHMCVEAAVRAGADLGFDIAVVEDACATRDLKLHETTIPAASVHAAALAAMNGTYAKVVAAAEVVAALR